jgi:hypothetical protein
MTPRPTLLEFGPMVDLVHPHLQECSMLVHVLLYQMITVDGRWRGMNGVSTKRVVS